MTTVKDAAVGGSLGALRFRRPNFRQLAVTGVLAATVLGVGACGSGQISQTADQAPAVNGNQATIGSISLRNVRVDFPSSVGADARATNRRGSNATLLFSAINNSADKSDTLTGISTDAGEVRISRPRCDDSDHPELAPQQVLDAARPKTETPMPATGADPCAQPGTAPISVQITNLKRDLTPGLTVPVKFTFAHSGNVTVAAPIDAGADTPRQISPKSPGHTE